MLKFTDRLQHAWNAFMNRDPTVIYRDTGPGLSYRPDRPRLHRGNERTIVTAILNRIAMDAATAEIRHVRLDEHDRFLEEIHSGLDNCLTLDANIDQTGRAFVHDVVLSMLDEGCVAIVPTDTSINPNVTSSYDILEMRTGQILEWHPRHVKVRVYNEQKGRQEDVILQKSTIAIVENPMYAVMNEPNSTLQRLIRKLTIMDIIDEQTGAGKLDLIIQLPYVIKSEARRVQAENRRKDIEMQLAGSKYGIAYTDGTEHITQLNRSVDNQLMTQVEYLTSTLYGQLGMTAEIMNGTANEQTMNNYYARIIEPILSAIVDEMIRTFLTKTARAQRQSIMFFRDPFKLIPTTQIADIADRFTRNEIMTSNELRQVIGMKPSTDPKADELRNKNMPVADTGVGEEEVQNETESLETDEEALTRQLANLDDLDRQLDGLEQDLSHGQELKHYASPYYDPVKAHEYYMKNRELKGRKSTAGLSEEGRIAASYVKQRLNNEQKAVIADSKARMERGIEASKARTAKVKATNKANLDKHLSSEKAKVERDIANHAAQMQRKIETLQATLKRMGSSKAGSETIRRQIAELRSENGAKRKELQAAYGVEAKNSRETTREQNNSASKTHRATSSALRSEHKQNVQRIKDAYDDYYVSELAEMRKSFGKR